MSMKEIYGDKFWENAVLKYFYRKCKNSSRYKGIREPRCLGGFGCMVCWEKYEKNNNYR